MPKTCLLSSDPGIQTCFSILGTYTRRVPSPNSTTGTAPPAPSSAVSVQLQTPSLGIMNIQPTYQRPAILIIGTTSPTTIVLTRPGGTSLLSTATVQR